jgi:hypothetical protein
MVPSCYRWGREADLILPVNKKTDGVRITVTLRRVRVIFFCREISGSITQLVCAFVALGIQHAMRTRHINICGLLRSTIFFHMVS